MMTRNLLLLVSLCVWEGLTGGAATGRIVRRKGVGASRSGKLVERDAGVDAVALPVVTLRNLISYEQAADSGAYSRSKPLQGRATQSAANGERKAFKPKRELDSVGKTEAAPHAKELVREAKKAKNNTRNAEGRAGKSDKSLHRKSELHGNRTRLACRSRCRPDAAGVPGKGFGTDSARKLNLTGSYGVLKLLSKDNLVRIVNSQMQSAPSWSAAGKGGRSRKRDLIDVNLGQSEAQKAQRQDAPLHSGPDNETAVPHGSLVTGPDPNPPGEGSPDGGKGQARVGARVPDRSPSTPRSEVGLTPEKHVTASQTEPPLAPTKHFPPHALAAMNDAPPSVLTVLPLGARGGAADSHRDPLAESARSAQTELSTARYPPDEDNKLVNSSHVLKLRPAPAWSRGGEETSTQVAASERGNSLVFEEAEEEAGRAEPPGPRSRSRRSWIWNQFFVIEEYAGPEPVLIGRVSGRTTFIHHLRRL